MEHKIWTSIMSDEEINPSQIFISDWQYFTCSSIERENNSNTFCKITTTKNIYGCRMNKSIDQMYGPRNQKNPFPEAAKSPRGKLLFCRGRWRKFSISQTAQSITIPLFKKMNQFGGIIYKSLYHHKSSSSIQLVSVNNESNASDNLWTFRLPSIKTGYK